ELIGVLPALLSTWPDVQLVFPGPGEDRNNLRALAARKGVAASVFLPGLVSNETLMRLYRRCYAFVMPSRQEGFGLVYLEAMNFGKPCVGCFDQGAAEVIVHGETGLLVEDPGDADELLGALHAILRQPEYAKELGRRGFQRLLEHFTATHVQACLKEKLAAIL
ncbi:MAG: glycosyltransferase family 4 protein, partial [Gemmatimonadetes bacterium]|nr:glycosyltransferase family 4 protein [Gemmatimonadota bacterium]